MGAFSFKPEMIAAIRQNIKTETRRVAKLNETFGPNDLQRVVTWNGDRCTTKWRVGQDYAMVPGRGIPAAWLPPGGGAPVSLADLIRRYGLTGDALVTKLYGDGFMREQIHIDAIRFEPLGLIDDAHARMEGVADRRAFIDLWESINGKDPRTRFAADPNVWVISFRYLSGLPF